MASTIDERGEKNDQSRERERKTTLSGLRCVSRLARLVASDAHRQSVARESQSRDSCGEKCRAWLRESETRVVKLLDERTTQFSRDPLAFLGRRASVFTSDVLLRSVARADGARVRCALKRRRRLQRRHLCRRCTVAVSPPSLKARLLPKKQHKQVEPLHGLKKCEQSVKVN